MELTDLIVQLNRESAKNTPDVYKKVMAAARAEGLVKSKKKNSSRQSQSQSRKYDDYDYDYDYDYGYRGGSTGGGSGSGIARRVISWIIGLALLALSIFAVTYTIKIVIVKEGDGTENGGQPPASEPVPEGVSDGQTAVYYADGGTYGVMLESVD